MPRDTSFEHPLDETAPKPEPVHDGDGIEIPRLGGERRDDRPRAPADAGRASGQRSCKYLDAARFHSLFHLLRSPKYLALSVLWASSAWSGLGQPAACSGGGSASSRSCGPRP